MDWSSAFGEAYQSGGGAASSSGGGGWMSAIGSMFGGDSGGGSSGGGMWGAIAQGILSGIGSSSRSSSDRRARKEELEMLRATQLENTRAQGDEGRRTIDFERRLSEGQRLNERA